MAEVLQPYCTKCGYKCEEMRLGFEAGLEIYECTMCNSIFQIKVESSRQEDVSCPLCANKISRKRQITPIHIFFKSKINPNFKNSDNCFYKCPKCKEKKFVFFEKKHCLLKEEYIPKYKEGQIVQGQFVGLTLQGNDGVVQLEPGFKARLDITGLKLEPLSFVECVVIEITDKIYCCKLKFLKEIKVRD